MLVESRLQWKRLVGLATKVMALLFVGSGWYYLNREMSFFHYPRAPQPEAGLVIPHEVKGIIVYITPDEQNLVEMLMLGNIISGVLLAGLVLYNKHLLQAGKNN